MDYKSRNQSVTSYQNFSRTLLDRLTPLSFPYYVATAVARSFLLDSNQITNMRLDRPIHQRRRSTALATEQSTDRAPQLGELVLPVSESIRPQAPDARDDYCTPKLRKGNRDNLLGESRDTSPSSSLSSIDEVGVGIGNVSLKGSSAVSESDSLRNRFIKIGSKSVIGRGQFSCVVRAIDSKLMRLCAMKEITISNESNRGQAEAEVKFVQSFGGVSVKHENIIAIYQTLVSISTTTFVMEYASMGSLQDVIDTVGISCRNSTSILPFSWISAIGRATFSALHFLHINNYAHFDIKPGNIMLFGNGGIKLSDFGCCKKLGPKGSEMLGQCISADGACAATGGTLAFMSPEQLLGGSTIGTKSDIFSAGMTLLECVESSDQERCGYWDVLELTEMRTKEIGKRRDLPRPFQQLLLLCFRDENNRPSAGMLLDHDFFRGMKARITDRAFTCLAERISPLPRASQQDIDEALEIMKVQHGSFAVEAALGLLTKEL